MSAPKTKTRNIPIKPVRAYDILDMGDYRRQENYAVIQKRIGETTGWHIICKGMNKFHARAVADSLNARDMEPAPPLI